MADPCYDDRVPDPVQPLPRIQYMAKVIISPGFGSPFYGAVKDRFDPELIRIMEEREIGRAHV